MFARRAEAPRAPPEPTGIRPAPALYMDWRRSVAGPGARTFGVAAHQSEGRRGAGDRDQSPIVIASHDTFGFMSAKVPVGFFFQAQTCSS